jgi:membrane associated rhomboid family serine protease
MIPLRDENPTIRTPFVTLALIGLNIAVYLYQFFLPEQAEWIMLHKYGVVPAWITGLAEMAPPADWFPRSFTLVTSAFLHGGLWHLAGNMLYLWIFGNNIEDALGPLRFMAFYLTGGILAGISQVLVAPSSVTPMVGASGAIAAVLGAYLVLYPRHKVVVLVVFIFFIQMIRVPAILVLGVWFLFQVLGAGSASVAWMAHIGGFVAGLWLIRFFLPRPRR